MRENKNHEGSSVADSPIMQLFDLLPIQSENLFPRIRFVFALRRDPSSSCCSATNPANKSSSETTIIQKVLSRLSGGIDCFAPSSSASSAAKSHHTCLITFPLSLTKSSAQKIITSQLRVFGKHWSNEMMQEAISTLPDSTESSSTSASSSFPKRTPARSTSAARASTSS